MDIEEFKYSIPEESRGVITENVIKLREIEAKLRKIFSKHNIEEVLIPLFEYVDLYKSVYTNFDEEKVFKYIGKDGKVIALRWDFTIPIARHYFSHNIQKEIRYSYFGKVYRKEKKFLLYCIIGLIITFGLSFCAYPIAGLTGLAVMALLGVLLTYFILEVYFEHKIAQNKYKIDLESYIMLGIFLFTSIILTNEMFALIYGLVVGVHLYATIIRRKKNR